MKRKKLNTIPNLTSENGTLKGGFSTLTEQQMARIGGGANNSCRNENCGMGTNNGCTNVSLCTPGTNASACSNLSDCICIQLDEIILK